MDSANIQHLAAMAAYMAAVVGIGIAFARRANKNAEAYFLGGRTLGPWVAAFSAEASDMSGYLLMGIPGLAYRTGLADAGWTAIGLFLGTYLNWLVVARRLRRYTGALGAFTVPEFFSRRFREKNRLLLLLSSLFIVIFFTVYAGQCLAACGKLFGHLFGLDYHAMMLTAAVFVLLYTFLGGFLAESASDFMQAVVMITALVAILALAVSHAGGWAAVADNARSLDGFLSLRRTAVPDAAGGCGTAQPFGGLRICSALAWGLGYFGMPQVLLRFMGIRKEEELTRSRRVACIWLAISMTAAVLIGVVGRGIPGLVYTSDAEAEAIFMDTATAFLPPLLAGVACTGILAASVSSSDSYLLISTSALAENLYHGLLKKDASDRQVMRVSRLAMAGITAAATVIAWDADSTVFGITAFAWAGFGAAFGPLMLFSLFWKRTTRAGALAGMVSGGVLVFVWKLAVNGHGGVWDVYCLLPAFLVSSLVIVAVSLLTDRDAALEAEFDRVIRK